MLDTVTACWLPDMHYLFGDSFGDYGFDDTRYLTHDIRLFLTTNTINPQIWKVTKINELQPKGVLKFTVKEDEFDEKKDNVELMVCNYYDDAGDITIDEPINDDPDPAKTSTISWAVLNGDGELEKAVTTDKLRIGNKSYFIADFSDDKAEAVQWRVEYVNVTPDDDKLSDERKAYYCGLLNISQYGESIIDEKMLSSIVIKVSKMNGLKGKRFLLVVQDHNGEYKSSIELEVKA